MCHLRFAGSAQTTIQPASNEWFGPANDIAQKLHAEDQLTTEHVVHHMPLQVFEDLGAAAAAATGTAAARNGSPSPASQAAAATVGPATPASNAAAAASDDRATLLGAEPAAPTSTCSTRLSCARDVGSKASTRDYQGLLGASCEHGVPLVGSLVDMPTNESFAYHFICILAIALRQPPVLGALSVFYFMVDFACRMKSSWAKLLQRWYAPPVGLGDIKLFVPWFHGESHSSSCQVLNSARFEPGMGRRIGENQESIWSQSKVILTLYVSLHLHSLLASPLPSLLQRAVGRPHLSSWPIPHRLLPQSSLCSFSTV
jgi:hypothetical protein